MEVRSSNLQPDDPEATFPTCEGCGCCCGDAWAGQ